jgi:apolipoprotein D and lipocalin family protein
MEETSMIKNIAVAGCMAALTMGGAQASESIDPQAYLGLWYEIARTPTPFQEQCEGGVTALYEQIDAVTVSVVNRCDLPGGEISSVAGRAEEVGDSFRRFEVSFDGVPDGEEVNYVIEAVGPVENGRYAWAAISDGAGGTGWILSPRLDLDEMAREEATAALEAADVATQQLSVTPQPPRNYDPS